MALNEEEILHIMEIIDLKIQLLKESVLLLERRVTDLDLNTLKREEYEILKIDCPTCGKQFSERGLYGHAMMAHNLQIKQIKEHVINWKVDHAK